MHPILMQMLKHEFGNISPPLGGRSVSPLAQNGGSLHPFLPLWTRLAHFTGFIDPSPLQPICASQIHASVPFPDFYANPSNPLAPEL